MENSESLLPATEGISDISQFNCFSEYLSVFEKEICGLFDIHVVKHLLDSDSPELKSFLVEKNVPAGKIAGGMLTAYNAAPSPLKHLILLELPFSGYGKRQYTMLATEGSLHVAAIKSTAAVIVTAYSYFNVFKAAEKRSEMFLSLLSCMISAVDAKDPVTSGHSQRVAELSEKLAAWMGLSESETDEIRFSGLIHDVGKIGIPDKVLGKQGPLSGTEYKIMQSHPLTGESIMKAVNLKPEILDGVMYHHERLDGRGYPYGKAGEELSITARIVKVADVFDALSSERQYKKAWPLDRVLGMLYQGIGTEFDGDVVKTLIKNLKPEGFEPPPMRAGGGNRALSPFLLNKCKEKALQMLGAFDDSAIKPGTEDYPADLKSEEDFGGIEWYGAFYKDEFLQKKPQILYAEPGVVIFGIRERHRCLIYYFLRNFMTMGAYVFDETGKALPKLEAELGKPDADDDSFYTWDKGRMLVLLWEGDSHRGARVAYAMKSVAEED